VGVGEEAGIFFLAGGGGEAGVGGGGGAATGLAPGNPGTVRVAAPALAGDIAADIAVGPLGVALESVTLGILGAIVPVMAVGPESVEVAAGILLAPIFLRALTAEPTPLLIRSIIPASLSSSYSSAEITPLSAASFSESEGSEFCTNRE
jgi:hypothetical protein